MTITLKLQYREDIRRVTLDSKPGFQALLQMVASMFQLERFAIKYKDEDGDLCTISSDLELQEAIAHTLSLLVSEQSASASMSLASRNMVRLYVTDSDRDPFATSSSVSSSFALPTSPSVGATAAAAATTNTSAAAPSPATKAPAPATSGSNTTSNTTTTNTNTTRPVDIAAVLSALKLGPDASAVASNLAPLLAQAVPAALNANSNDLSTLMSGVLSSLTKQPQQQPGHTFGNSSAATYFTPWSPDDPSLIPTTTPAAPATTPAPSTTTGAHTTPEPAAPAKQPEQPELPVLASVTLPITTPVPIDTPSYPTPPTSVVDPNASLVMYNLPTTTTPTPTPTTTVPTPTPTLPAQPVAPVDVRPVQPKYLARFVRDSTLTDGSIVPANSSFVKTWRMRNDGAVAWPAGTQLRWVSGHQFAGEHSVSVPQAQPGQEIDISVQLRAPNVAGRCVGYFRLSTPDDTQFGHRVWVDVVVAEPLACTTPVMPEPLYPVTAQPQPLPVAPQPQPVPPQPQTVPQPPAFVVPGHLTAQVATLKEMGFQDEELLVNLLEKNNRDLQATMAQLLDITQ